MAVQFLMCKVVEGLEFVTLAKAFTWRDSPKGPKTKAADTRDAVNAGQRAGKRYKLSIDWVSKASI